MPDLLSLLGADVKICRIWNLRLRIHTVFQKSITFKLGVKNMQP